MKRLKEINDALDLTKKYPRYFTKWVFRSVIFILLGLVFLVFYVNDFDFTQQLYIECKGDYQCENPFYECKHNIIKSNIINCDEFNKLNCPYDLCNIEFIYPGQSYGKKPSKLQNNFSIITFLILLNAFILNHFIYRRRMKQ